MTTNRSPRSVCLLWFQPTPHSSKILGACACVCGDRRRGRSIAKEIRGIPCVYVRVCDRSTQALPPSTIRAIDRSRLIRTAAASPFSLLSPVVVSVVVPRLFIIIIPYTTSLTSQSPYPTHTPPPSEDHRSTAAAAMTNYYGRASYWDDRYTK